jgi:hypothetical protein
MGMLIFLIALSVAFGIYYLFRGKERKDNLLVLAIAFVTMVFLVIFNS